MLSLHFLRQHTLQPVTGKANVIFAFLVRFQNFKSPPPFHFVLLLYFHTEGLPDRNVHVIQVMSYDFSFKDNQPNAAQHGRMELESGVSEQAADGR